MDFTPSKRNAGVGATYGRRSRKAAPQPIDNSSTSSAASDHEDSHPQPGPSRSSPKKPSTKNQTQTATSHLPIIDKPVTPMQDPPSSQRPPPSQASPSKRSKSRSPRKSALSLSPQKRQVRPITPKGPARDLGDIFDAFSPDFSAPPASPFLNTNTTTELLDADAESQRNTAMSSRLSPQLPTLPRAESPSLQTSPQKRPKLSQRMAPRTFRKLTPADDSHPALAPISSRSLRRTETDPLAASRLKDTQVPHDTCDTPLIPPFRHSDAVPASGPSAQLQPLTEEQLHSLPSSPHVLAESHQGPTNPVPERRTQTPLPRTTFTGHKRTYGEQRSFLADNAEEPYSQGQPIHDAQSRPPSQSRIGSPALLPQGQTSQIEDEIESQLAANGHISTVSQSPHPSIHENGKSRESYADLLKRWGDHADDIEWDESQDPTLNLRSITSLRSVGELRRFNDDLDYLFSGFHASQPISLRRSSAVEFIRMLCGRPDVTQDEVEQDFTAQDPSSAAASTEFLRKLKASDGIVRVYDLFRETSAGDTNDLVLDVALMVFVGKLVKIPAMADPLLRERAPQLIECLMRLLLRLCHPEDQHRQDGLSLLRKTELGFPKALTRGDRSPLRELRSIAALSGLFLSGSVLPSLRNLIIANLCAIASLPRRIGAQAITRTFNREHEPDQSPSLIDICLQVFSTCGSNATQRLERFARGLDLSSLKPIESWPDLDSVDLCIRLLNQCMETLYIDLESAVPLTPEAKDSVIALFRFSMQAAPFDSTNSAVERTREERMVSDRSLELLYGLTKWLLDLTQVDASWSRSLATSAPFLQTLLQVMFLAECSAGPEARALNCKSKAPTSKAPLKEEEEPTETSQKDAVSFLDDIVHLSLAVLTNLLIKQGDETRVTLLDLRLQPACWRNRSCAYSCECDGQISALTSLVRLFAHKKQTASQKEDANDAYLASSLATAIAQFAIGGETFLRSVQLEANSGTVTQQTDTKGQAETDLFSEIVDAVEEFADLHVVALRSQSQLDSDVTGSQIVMAPNLGLDTRLAGAEESGAIIRDVAVELRRLIGKSRQSI